MNLEELQVSAWTKEEREEMYRINLEYEEKIKKLQDEWRIKKEPFMRYSCLFCETDLVTKELHLLHLKSEQHKKEKIKIYEKIMELKKTRLDDFYENFVKIWNTGDVLKIIEYEEMHGISL